MMLLEILTAVVFGVVLWLLPVPGISKDEEEEFQSAVLELYNLAVGYFTKSKEIDEPETNSCFLNDIDALAVVKRDKPFIVPLNLKRPPQPEWLVELQKVIEKNLMLAVSQFGEHQLIEDPEAAAHSVYVAAKSFFDYQKRRRMIRKLARMSKYKPEFYFIPAQKGRIFSQ